MKFTTLKYSPVIYSKNATSLGIQTIGENNDFYQVVMRVISGSVSGSSCVDVYSKFINGRGFMPGVFDKKINKKGQTLDDLLRMIAEDYARFNGFAVHVNYNALGQKTSASHVPFEHLRLEMLDENGQFNKVAIHPDWAKEYTTLRKWKKEDIKFIDLYNPDLEAIQEQVINAGGWQEYKGQIFYYSGNRDISYPIPTYASALTDMSSDEGLSNINYRNIRNRFMSGGILVGIKKADETEEYEETEEEIEALKEAKRPIRRDEGVDMASELVKFQGDEDACKIGYMEVESRDDIPEFKPLQSNNYDKDYTSGEKSVKDKIGRAFNQPPILRAENIGAGFGSELMQACYDYYNSVTETERYDIERAFTEIFTNWKYGEITNFTIQPKTWGASTNAN